MGDHNRLLLPRQALGAIGGLPDALMEVTSDALDTDELQIVVLNDAAPLLRHRAMRDGVRLVDRDAKSRIRLETTSLLEYLDTAPLRATLASGLRRRIAEGRFGLALKSMIEIVFESLDHPMTCVSSQRRRRSCSRAAGELARRTSRAA